MEGEGKRDEGGVGRRAIVRHRSQPIVGEKVFRREWKGDVVVVVVVVEEEEEWKMGGVMGGECWSDCVGRGEWNAGMDGKEGVRLVTTWHDESFIPFCDFLRLSPSHLTMRTRRVCSLCAPLLAPVPFPSTAPPYLRKDDSISYMRAIHTSPIVVSVVVAFDGVGLCVGICEGDFSE
ncbi:unnamed protein product [Hydatigera taeniaeformis]|uniref:Uncharacterized protein n=1 Tax=Hydatigena taeniaeformis TaxID=6205 RepID=A0A0R3XA70_HYDTA|nr:unnamed protein product [Hydatigera taeniaeformis]